MTALDDLFPVLRQTRWRVTSAPADAYNCVAWAVGDTTRWWWPAPGNDVVYWPEGVAQEETVPAFTAPPRRVRF